MRYRQLDANGDYAFGRGGQFLVDSPEVVAQAIKTRLLLMAGEWFLDETEGTPYATQILGNNTQGTRDQAIKERILDTPGVDELTSYQSSVTNRKLTIAARVATIYGVASITINF